MNKYYEPMTQKSFEEIKKASMDLWDIIDTDGYGYKEEKKSRIVNLENIQDNGMYMVAMFDIHNQSLLASMISDEAKAEIRERMIAGGTPQMYIRF